MVWYYVIDVCITNRTLHGCLEIHNFPFGVEKKISLVSAFSLRLLVAGERCNITGEYFQGVPCLNKICHRLLNISWRILHSKRRILWSPAPSEHPEFAALTCGIIINTPKETLYLRLAM